MEKGGSGGGGVIFDTHIKYHLLDLIKMNNVKSQDVETDEVHTAAECTYIFI